MLWPELEECSSLQNPDTVPAYPMPHLVFSSLQHLPHPDPFTPNPLHQAVPNNPYTWAALRRGRSPGGVSKSSGGLLGGGDSGWSRPFDNFSSSSSALDFRPRFLGMGVDRGLDWSKRPGGADGGLGCWGLFGPLRVLPPLFRPGFEALGFETFDISEERSVEKNMGLWNDTRAQTSLE